MIECYDSTCRFHLVNEPYCGEAECVARPESPDGEFCEETEYEAKAVQPAPVQPAPVQPAPVQPAPVQMSFDFGGER